MVEFWTNDQKIPRVNDIVEGTVIKKDKMAVFLDLDKIGTGIIYGREYLKNKEQLKKIKIGDKLIVKIVEPENEEGYIEVQPTKILQIQKKQVLSLKVKDIQEKGIVAISPFDEKKEIFIPSNQLPQDIQEMVENNDRSLVNKEIQITLENEQLQESDVFSFLQRKEISGKIKEGEILEGTVSGITSFGVFVRIKNDEGLIPFSLAENKELKVGKKVKVKVEKISRDKIFLSLTS